LLPTGIQNVTADGEGNLNVNVQVGGGGGGGSDVTIVGQTVTLNTEDAADNIVGQPAGTDAIQIGFTDGSGNTRIPSASNPLPVTLGAAVAVVTGNKTNNNATPGATNIGALVAVANAAVQTWTEGDEVLLSVDLSGSLRVNNQEWGGVAVTAATASAPVGTETAPVSRTINRKFAGNLETNTPLAANGVYTGAAHDTAATGDVSVSVAFLASALGSTTDGARIQVSEDNSNWSNASTATVVGTVQLILQASIASRYWRITYTNGGTLQTSFQVLWTATNVATTPLATGTVGNAAPTYAAGDNDALSLTTGGALRVATAGTATTPDGVTVVSPINSTAANSNPIATGIWVSTNNPASGTGFVAQRTPAIFKTASVPATASGNTAVWTPTSGKKFRLMRFQITAQGLSATAATILTISFQDATTAINIGTYDVLLPAAANLQAGITTVSAWVDLGNGVLSAAANNVLNANISATVTGATGTFRVNACGTEE
jgi:hypothetical protein